MPQRGLLAPARDRPTGPREVWTHSLSHCLSLRPGKKLERKTGRNDFTLQERRRFAFYRGRDVQSSYRSHPHFKGRPPLPIQFLPASVYLLSHKLNSFILPPSSWQVLKQDKGGGIRGRTDEGKQDTAVALGPLQSLHMLEPRGEALRLTYSLQPTWQHKIYKRMYMTGSTIHCATPVTLIWRNECRNEWNEYHHWYISLISVWVRVSGLTLTLPYDKLFLPQRCFPDKR